VSTGMKGKCIKLLSALGHAGKKIIQGEFHCFRARVSTLICDGYATAINFNQVIASFFFALQHLLLHLKGFKF